VHCPQIDTQQLDRQIKAIMTEVIPFLKVGQHGELQKNEVEMNIYGYCLLGLQLAMIFIVD